MTTLRSTRRRATNLAAAAGLVCAAATLVFAQQIWIAPGPGGLSRMAPKWATPADFVGAFLYCRGYFEQVRYESGGMGWWTDYPNADHNFSVRLAELTRVPVPFDGRREPNFVVVRLSDPLLFRCPLLFMEDVGTAKFSDSEVRSLREYFLKGGFLWVDDFWGSRAWSYWVTEISRVLPPNDFPIFDIPETHPIMHALYDVKTIPQVPSINFWSRDHRGRTSERGADSSQVHWRGIQDDRGRLMVLMSHNTDIADTWEREGESQAYFDLFSPRGYAIGVNVVLYALTH